jgi:hypothetical protein
VPIPAHPADSPQARARRPARAPFFPVAALCASTSCARRVAVRKREGARPLWHRSAPRPPSAGSTYDRVILSPWRVDRRTAVRRPTHLSNRRPLFQRWRSTFERKRQDHREPNPGGDPITPPRALLVSSAGRSGSFSPPPLAKLPLRAIRGRRARRRCRGRRASVPRRPVAKPRSTQRTLGSGRPARRSPPGFEERNDRRVAVGRGQLAQRLGGNRDSRPISSCIAAAARPASPIVIAGTRL